MVQSHHHTDTQSKLNLNYSRLSARISAKLPSKCKSGEVEKNVILHKLQLSLRRDKYSGFMGNLKRFYFQVGNGWGLFAILIRIRWINPFSWVNIIVNCVFRKGGKNLCHPFCLPDVIKTTLIMKNKSNIGIVSFARTSPRTKMPTFCKHKNFDALSLPHSLLKCKSVCENIKWSLGGIKLVAVL
jgi:hypothetical protein